MVLLWSVWVSLIYMWSYLVVLHSSIINMFVYAELLFFYCSVVLWLENVKSACLPIRALDCDFFESVRVKIWRGRTCASAWSALLQSVCAEEPGLRPFHTARVSRAEAAQKRRICRVGAACAHCAFTRRVSTSTKVRAADGVQRRIWFSN